MTLIIPSHTPCQQRTVRPSAPGTRLVPRSTQSPNILQVNINVSKPVQQEYGNHNDREPAHITQQILRTKTSPLSKQNRASNNHKTGEDDVVHRCNDVRVEEVKRLVQVVHLQENAKHHRDEEGIREPTVQVVRATTRRLLDGQAQAFARHYGEAADGRTEADVDQDVATPVSAQKTDMSVTRNLITFNLQDTEGIRASFC